MQTEAQGYMYLIPANQSVLQDYLGATEQSTEHFEGIHLLSEGNESLATSKEAAQLQQELMKLTHDLYFDWWEEDWAPASRLSEQFPVLLDTSIFLPQEELVDASLINAQNRLLSMLQTSFDENPIEDGIDHPAEGIIANAIQFNDAELVFDWLKVFSLDAERPSSAASILRCLGRLKCFGEVSWRVDLIRRALTMEDVEIRDAAVQAAECWGGEDILKTLKAHSEPLPWLQEYVSDVIEDFEE